MKKYECFCSLHTKLLGRAKVGRNLHFYNSFTCRTTVNLQVTCDQWRDIILLHNRLLNQKLASTITYRILKTPLNSKILTPICAFRTPVMLGFYSTVAQTRKNKETTTSMEWHEKSTRTYHWRSMCYEQKRTWDLKLHVAVNR